MISKLAQTHFNDCDWEDLGSVHARSSAFFAGVQRDPEALLYAARSLKEQPSLLQQSQCDSFFDRIVLYADSIGYTVRLHFLKTQIDELPHNHRATFAVLLLSGGYEHRIYDFDVDAPDLARGIAGLRPSAIRWERAGNAYALHHRQVHATMRALDHVSLVVRGPSARQELVFLDPARGSFSRLEGGAYKPPLASMLEGKRSEALSTSLLDSLCDKLATALYLTNQVQLTS
jgi:hypothetical protein